MPKLNHPNGRNRLSEGKIRFAPIKLGHMTPFEIINGINLLPTGAQGQSELFRALACHPGLDPCSGKDLCVYMRTNLCDKLRQLSIWRSGMPSKTSTSPGGTSNLVERPEILNQAGAANIGLLDPLQPMQPASLCWK